MSKFSFFQTIANMFTGWTKATVEVSEEMSEVDFAHNLKTAGDQFFSELDKKVTAMEDNKTALADAQTKITELTKTSGEQATQIANLKKQIEDADAKHAKQLTELKEEIRAELAKDPKSREGNVDLGLNDGKGKTPKEIVMSWDDAHM